MEESIALEKGFRLLNMTTDPRPRLLLHFQFCTSYYVTFCKYTPIKNSNTGALHCQYHGRWEWSKTETWQFWHFRKEFGPFWIDFYQYFAFSCTLHVSLWSKYTKQLEKHAKSEFSGSRKWVSWFRKWVSRFWKWVSSFWRKWVSAKTHKKKPDIVNNYKWKHLRCQ